MYIKLGTIGVNYPKIVSLNNFMIFSEVPRTTLSYESPKIVRTSDELDIWFGKSMPDREQLLDIIQSSGVLYLFAPGAPVDINSSIYRNRDTLLISIDEENIYTTHPGYNPNINDCVEPEGADPDIDPNAEGNTFAISITYPQGLSPSDIIIKEGYFICTVGGTQINLVFDSNHQGNLGTIEQALTSSGLNKIGGGTSGKLTFYSKTKNIVFDNFYAFKDEYNNDPTDVVIEADREINNKFLQKYIEQKKLPGIFFWSKTVGRDNDIYENSKDINISIETVEGQTRVTISRYSYVETFNGSFYPGQGETLDYIISRESKLVNCKIKSWNGAENRSFGQISLPVSATLEGATEIESTPNDYWTSLQYLLDLGEDFIYSDFILIPELSLWNIDDGREGIDNQFLEVAKTYHTQFLISETLPDEARNNLLNDVENWLIYFYGHLNIYENDYPAYYPFIVGVLNNSSGYYAKNVESLIFFGDNEIYPYVDTADSLLLDSYKCNYLVSNNQRCYYKKYNSGNNPSTTIWKRFIIEKVYRELEKNKWSFLGNKFNKLIKTEIESILKKISTNFSAVRRIEISEYNQRPADNSIDLTIDIYTTDLIDSNVQLNITINLY